MNEATLRIAVRALLVIAVLAILGTTLPAPWGLEDKDGAILAVGALSALAGLVTPRTKS